MDKVYLVYEGTYEDDHPYGSSGIDRTLVAVYPLEDMARHHLELWVSKTLKEIGTLNERQDEIVKRSKEIAEKYGTPNNCNKPVYWLPDAIKDSSERSFSCHNDQMFCHYEVHEVLKEVKVE